MHTVPNHMNEPVLSFHKDPPRVYALLVVVLYRLKPKSKVICQSWHGFFHLYFVIFLAGTSLVGSFHLFNYTLLSGSTI